MNFAHDLLDDVREREEGRNQLVSDMASLTQRMKESPIVGMKAKAVSSPTCVHYKSLKSLFKG